MIAIDLTDTALNAAFVSAANREDHEAMAALGAEATRRAVQARAEFDAAWEAEIDAVIATEVLTVVLTSAQCDMLADALPMSHFGLEILSTRAKGTRDQLTAALESIDRDALNDAVDRCMMNQFDELTQAREDFMTRQVTKCWRNLRTKLTAALK